MHLLDNFVLERETISLSIRVSWIDCDPIRWGKPQDRHDDCDNDPLLLLRQPVDRLDELTDEFNGRRMEAVDQVGQLRKRGHSIGRNRGLYKRYLQSYRPLAGTSGLLLVHARHARL